jgi:hypothetical protein
MAKLRFTRTPPSRYCDGLGGLATLGRTCLRKRRMNARVGAHPAIDRRRALKLGASGQPVRRLQGNCAAPVPSVTAASETSLWKARARRCCQEPSDRACPMMQQPPPHRARARPGLPSGRAKCNAGRQEVAFYSGCRREVGASPLALLRSHVGCKRDATGCRPRVASFTSNRSTRAPV